MKKLTKIAVLLLVVLAGSIGIQDEVFAQTPSIALNLTAGEMGIVIGLGVAGGLLHAYQGYRTGTEDFDRLKFIDGVITCTLASVPLAVGAAIEQAATGVPLNVFTYVMIFFASIGLGFQIQQAKQKTIPSNTA